MAKGPIVRYWEDLTTSLKDEMVAGYHALKAEQGDVPYGSVDLSPKEVALRYLSLWFVLGEADPEISEPWWAKLAASKVHGRPVGPVGALEFDQAMRKAWDDEGVRHDCLLAMDPDLRQQFQWLKSVGLHDGRIKEPIKAGPKRNISQSDPTAPKGGGY